MGLSNAHGVDAIKERFSVPDLFEHLDYAPKHGRYRCPIREHSTNGSLPVSVFEGKRRWRCHKCGDGGDVYDLLRHAEGLDFPGAKEVLSGLAGLPAGAPPSPEVQQRIRRLASAKEVTASLRLRSIEQMVDGRRKAGTLTEDDKAYVASARAEVAGARLAASPEDRRALVDGLTITRKAPEETSVRHSRLKAVGLEDPLTQREQGRVCTPAQVCSPAHIRTNTEEVADQSIPEWRFETYDALAEAVGEHYREVRSGRDRTADSQRADLLRTYRFGKWWGKLAEDFRPGPKMGKSLYAVARKLHDTGVIGWNYSTIRRYRVLADYPEEVIMAHGTRTRALAWVREQRKTPEQREEDKAKASLRREEDRRDSEVVELRREVVELRARNREFEERAAKCLYCGSAG